MRFPIGAMSVGDVLDRGIKLLFNRLGTFYLIYLVTLTPVLAFNLILPSLMFGDRGINPVVAVVGFVVGIFLQIIISAIGTAATIHVISQEFVDQRVSVGAAFSFALGRFGIVLGTSLLAGILIALGMLACLVPGIIFYLWWVFAANGQVPVIEGIGGDKALSRSKALTEGFRGRVFGILLLVGIVAGILQQVVQLAFNSVLPPFVIVPGEGGIRVVVNQTNHLIQVAAVFLVTALSQAYLSICATLLYFDLRIRKEGFDLELAAREQAGQKGLVP